MRDKSLGELLREARVSKKITLDEIESKTGISSHYLLAMELDQFKIIPANKLGLFLKQYADIVLLDFYLLKEHYNEQMSQRESQTDELSVTQIVEEKLSQQKQKQNNTIVVPPIKVSNVASDLEKRIAQKMQLQALIDQKPEKKDLLTEEHKTLSKVAEKSPVETSTRPSSVRQKNEMDFKEDLDKSRSSRYKEEDSKSKSFLSVILLCLIAMAIVVFIFFTVWQQFSKETKHVDDVKSTFLDQSKKSSSSSSEPKSKIKTEVQDNYLLATVEKAHATVEVTVTLKDAESAWISLTNSEIADAGTTLTVDSPSYTATFPAEVTESLLTLGLAQGVTLKIDGQEVDLTNLPTTNVSYIALQFNNKAE
ncbi:helix-turn-helix domain-containing protein [Streptococcus iniae]|uniref:helix-turn-helix domain-containing protein n=1 Tax=Streptococcus iniae TaxID=1346 RepID=UPI000EF6E095|nr:helix-turn-helix domain-containing protein [Streptococcus iniae]RLU48736.1 hypothetical protein DIY06_09560 [Streptococcus iniae]RLU73181.1 hypothetical protein DIY05_09695 [Streptococcus iniae]RLV00476.1 hypothetical protein DIX84_09625 [Streptococcus iniae]RLV16546.1 hypothetical protein DIX72_09590 [Streptococcus iniae]RLV21535.1 hypothetical protein DIX73_09575 [Streptococcus iniae]